MNSRAPRFAYHRTDDFAEVLREGLIVGKARTFGCPFGHLCLAETPEIAAAFGNSVLVVDLAGLDVPEEGFRGGEMRLHQDIPPEHLSLYPRAVEPSLAGHADPFYAYPERQHPTCVRLRNVQRSTRALPAPERKAPP